MNKKFLSSITASMLTITSTMPSLTFASDIVSESTILSNYINANYDDNYLSYEVCNDGVNPYKVMVITPEKAEMLTTFKTNSLIKVKNGTELPVEEINSQMPNSYYYLEKNDNNTYWIANNVADNDPTFWNVLNQYDNIVSVDGCNEIARSRDWTCLGISINTEMTTEEFIAEYSEIIFESVEVVAENCILVNFYEDDSFCNYLVSETHYNFIKKVSEDPNISDFSFEILESEILPEKICIYNENLYIAEITGDTNVDGDINISDVLTVSAHINNKDKYPMEEQSIINGDVHETGNGLNSSDAFMIQQYVTGVIESL